MFVLVLGQIHKGVTKGAGGHKQSKIGLGN